MEAPRHELRILRISEGVNRAVDLCRPFVVLFATGKQIAFLQKMDVVAAMDVDSNLTFLLPS